MPKLGACHLLIKHEKSRNPVSRRTNQSTSGVSVEAAHAELNTFIEKINADAATDPDGLQGAFMKHAKARSDCGSFQNGGNLGEFGPGEMQSQFENGTRGIEVGQMSGIVDSDSGSHLIYRWQ